MVGSDLKGCVKEFMRITTKIVVSMLTGEILEHEYFDYDGPLALCDRAAQAAAKSAAGTRK